MTETNLLLKIETTGLDRKLDKLLQILIIDLEGNIIYCKTFNSGLDENSGLIYNHLSQEILSNCPKYDKEEIVSEVNKLVYNSNVYSFNKDFDSSFLPIKPLKWLDILALINKRKRIPNLENLRVISSPIYRKALNILELMREYNLVPQSITDQEITLNF